MEVIPLKKKELTPFEICVFKLKITYSGLFHVFLVINNLEIESGQMDFLTSNTLNNITK